jgi:hypothetical protein
MKYLLVTISLFLALLSCNLNKDRKLSEEEMRELAKAHNDSVTVIVDSLTKTSIYIPPLYDKEVFDSATTVKFFELAKATQGELKLLVNSKLISAEVINILKSNAENNADLLILMDKTGSMEDDIVNVREGLGQIIDVLKSYQNVRLGIALYGDKNEDGPGWFSFRNFETNYYTAKNFINQIEVTAGGDYPESVYEGFFKACEQHFWKSESKRMIILIGDAPPLEKPLSKYEVTDVIAKAGESNIKMNFYPIVVQAAVGETINNQDVKTFEREKIISTVFPNPASTVINMNLLTNDSYSIDIFNAAGNLIWSDTFSGSLWKWDVSKLPNGAYIARVIRKDKKFESIKFIVYR